MLKHEILGTRLAAKRGKLHLNIEKFKAQKEFFFLLLKKEFRFFKKVLPAGRQVLSAKNIRVGLKLFVLIGLLTTTTLGGSFGFNLGGRATAVGGQTKTKALGVAISEVTVKELPFEVSAPLEEGEKSQGFYRYHPGIDIAASYGSPVKTIGEGVVLEIGYRYDGLGRAVVVAHPGGFKSIYAHLSKIEVKKDEVVKSGKVIGYVGLTGRTTGAHLHLEVYEDGKALDPENLLPKDYTPNPILAKL